ncbi:MAG: tyrosine-type recombinase/integrase [Planctomycetaceae bacterium]
MQNPHKVKPWFRDHDGWWYVTLKGGGRRKQVKLARGRENEPEAYRRFYEVMAAAGHIEPSPEMTFNELAAQFLSYSREQHKSVTTNWYVRLLDDFDQHCQGRVKDLKKSHVDTWLRKHTWSVSSRRQAITAIKRVVNWGYEEGHLPEYPVGLRKLKRPKMQKRETLVSEADHKRMLKATDPEFALFLTALWETGARPGEIRTVTADDVLLEQGIWLLQQHKTAEKTEKPRIIYLTEAMVKLTQSLVKEHPTGPLFRNSQGEPWTINAIRCRMRRLREKLGLPVGTVAYAYRHTYATNGLTGGISIAEMAELLGHSDTKMLSEHYGHLSQKTQHMREIAHRAVHRKK